MTYHESVEQALTRWRTELSIYPKERRLQVVGTDNRLLVADAKFLAAEVWSINVGCLQGQTGESASKILDAIMRGFRARPPGPGDDVERVVSLTLSIWWLLWLHQTQTDVNKWTTVGTLKIVYTSDMHSSALIKIYRAPQYRVKHGAVLEIAKLADDDLVKALTAWYLGFLCYGVDPSFRNTLHDVDMPENGTHWPVAHSYTDVVKRLCRHPGVSMTEKARFSIDVLEKFLKEQNPYEVCEDDEPAEPQESLRMAAWVMALLSMWAE
ncbi:hypothetical protein AURDEDRAFT_128148 [Auricularia subglabra TFB-10046 SS5]|nr:hypothetical protein AURDEDRAFT_128148 [Auricularia subglabra TFB-10046 SS5]